MPVATFATALSYSSGGYLSSSVAVGDVNADGKPDLLVANECAGTDGSTCVGNGTVSVLLNNGDGTFQPPATYGSAGYQATSVALADVNADGKPDLLVANACVDGSNCDHGTVGVLLNNGDGTFQTAVSYGAGGYHPASVAVADLNGDGKPDLLIASNCSASDCAEGGVVSVLQGNGDGTFQAPVTYFSGGYNADSLATADVNGDSKLDLLVANRCADSSCSASNGVVGVLLGNGDATFHAAVAYGSGGYQANSAAAADVNADGKVDLLVANACVESGNCDSGTVSVLQGAGDGTFQSAVPYSSGGYASASLTLGDVNGDGLPDVVVTNQCATATTCASGGTVAVLLSNGDGTLQTPALYGSGGSQADSVAVGDVNADGKPDILVANQCLDASCSVGAVSVLINLTPKHSTTTLISSQNPSGFGQAVTFTATVTPSATGTVTFTDSANILGTVTLTNGAATLTTSALLTGTHFITAAYGGDSNFTTSTSPALSQGINPAATTIVLSPSQNPAFVTLPMTITTTVAGQFGGSVGGSVTFYSGTAQLGTAAVSSGQAILLHTFSPTGTYPISATYSGDTNNAASTSSVLSESVTRIPITATISSGLNPSTYGQTVVFTAYIDFSPGTPPSNETVNFKEITNGEILLGTSPLVGNTAVFSISTLTIGSHNIKVQYLGDKLFMNGHSAVVPQVVKKSSTSTSLSSNLNPSIFGQAVTLTATVTTSGAIPPAGKVTFKRGTITLGTPTLSGATATLTTSTLNAGSGAVTAAFAGDSSNAASTSPGLAQQVNKAPTSILLTSSQNPSTKGQPVTFTAILSSTTGPIPTGTVTFKTGATTLCTTTLASGGATCTVSTLLHGAHTIQATYPANTNFLGNSSSLVQTVN